MKNTIRMICTHSLVSESTTKNKSLQETKTSQNHDIAVELQLQNPTWGQKSCICLVMSIFSLIVWLLDQLIDCSINLLLKTLIICVWIFLFVWFFFGCRVFEPQSLHIICNILTHWVKLTGIVCMIFMFLNLGLYTMWTYL